jgi:O-antigen/teichoic acid export membrane protein
VSFLDRFNLPKNNLTYKAIDSSIWVGSGYGLSQLLRLASNVILAKLLFPDIFGLMMLVTIFMQAISMFSDLGTGASIVQNKRGDSSDFLNTAWTLQLFRGILIWIVAIILSPYYADFYNEPELEKIIPVAGLTAIISGLNSTSISSANRNLNLKKFTLLGVISQFITIVVMISWALYSPTVWALVIGTMVGNAAKMILSHLWLDGIKNKIFIDKTAATEIFKFGRWIFLSTGLTFLLANIDRILLGYLMDTYTLGVYTIAIMFNSVSLSVLQLIGNKVLFPSFSSLVREGDYKKINRALKKTLISMVVTGWLSSLFMMTLGSYAISVLYNENYENAVWMIQILPLSMLVGVLALCYQNVIMAQGRPSLLVVVNLLQLCIHVIAITLGHYYFGLHGIVFGYTFVAWIMYPINAFLAKKSRIWQPKLDALVLVAAILYTVLYLNILF